MRTVLAISFESAAVDPAILCKFDALPPSSAPRRARRSGALRVAFIVAFAISLCLTLGFFGCARPHTGLYYLTVSPDGKEIMFALDNEFTEIFSVFAVDIENQTARRITPADIVATRPKYSRDGDKITYAGDPYEPRGDDYTTRSIEDRIYYAERDGSNPTAITGLHPPDSNPLFSGDGSKIYFQRPTIRGPGTARWFDHLLHVIDLETLETRRLSKKKFEYFNSMVLSHEGDEIIVCTKFWSKQSRPKPIRPGMLWRIGLEGDDEFRMIPLYWARDSERRAPAFRISDDGISFVSLIPGENALVATAWIYADMSRNAEGAAEIVRIDLDAGEIEMITDLRLSQIGFPNFTPDGESILYVVGREVVRLDKDGTNPRLVLTDPALRASLGLAPKPNEEEFFQPQYPSIKPET